MLFYHISENRLELKRQRVTDFFPSLPPLLLRQHTGEVRQSIREKFADRRRKSKSVALKLEQNGSRFPNFLTKTIKRCKQRVDRGAKGVTRRDRDVPAMIFLSARFAICQEMDVNRYRGPGEKYRNLVENLQRRP